MSYNPKYIKRTSQPQLGSEALQSLFENGKTLLSQQFLRWKMWRKWSDFVGPTMSQHSEPVGFLRGTLYIWVESSTWMQQMVFLRDPMMDSINKKLGFNFVKNVHLTLDKKSVPRDAAEAAELKQSIAKLMKDEESST
jgi:predicted nucleic acid-binding Zn ribbon protein